MLNLDKQRTDTGAESGGAWFTLIGGMRVKVARVDETALSDALGKELGLEGLKAARDGKLPDRDFARARNIAIGLLCLKDWEPVELAGAEFPFSDDNRQTLLRDDSLHDIRDGIAQIAQSQAAFREAFLKDAEKN